VGTTTAQTGCGVTLQLYVTTTDGAPFTRVGDITQAAGCGAQSAVLVAPPTLHGTPIVGHVITATSPVWSATPMNVRYRWERCSGSSCAAIAGATGRMLALTKPDAGRAIRVLVTATIAGETVRASSRSLTVRGKR
jgi:hypothetical protein